MNCNRRIIYALSFLIFAEVDLLGCAFSGEQVLAERTERQKLENVYREVKEALTKQVAIVQESDGKLARLQLLLLEKELQKKELNRKIEEAMLEVVRTKAKLLARRGIAALGAEPASGR
jgi:uncharacterized protein YajQ (UPF0234 family)